jgi:ribosome-associated translation inhibitor RaiA
VSIVRELEVHVAVPHGHVDHDIKDYLRRKISRVAELAPAPILFARAQLDITDNPAVERPVEARAALDVNGAKVRARVTATEPTEAVDLLESKLRDELEHLAEHRLARRRRPASTENGRWRHGDLPSPRPDHFPRTPDDREIVARVTWARTPLSVGEALAELDLLGHDFELFTERETASDAVIATTADGTVLVTLAGARAPGTGDVEDPVEIHVGAPELALEEAVDTLDLGGQPYVFFVDRATGRGAVVHHRYDGHIGLVTA